MDFLNTEHETIETAYIKKYKHFLTHEEKTINIIYVNIRNVNKNFEELSILLHEINLRSIDVVVLSEVWNVEQLNKYDIIVQ